MKLFCDTLTSVAGNEPLEKQLLTARNAAEFLQILKDEVPVEAY